ncbi:hypothetical protein D3C76_1823810 [compost metagenome]
MLLDGVGILDAQLREALGQRRHRLAAAQGVEQFVAQRRDVDGSAVHGVVLRYGETAEWVETVQVHVMA